MGLTQLIVLALIAVADSPDATRLVGELSSPHEAARSDAAGALEELGRPALPTLYRARDGATPGVRATIDKLIDVIERKQLLHATPVRLDFSNKPLTAVADALRAQTGFRVTVAGDRSLGARQITLHSPEPVPFWEALDRIAAASRARHVPAVPFSGTAREAELKFVMGEGPAVPASDAGPFRVQLVHLARHREVALIGPSAEARARESLLADFHVFAEPGLAVNPIGPLVLKEAIDDRDRDRRPDPPTGSDTNRLRSPRFEEGHAALFAVSVPLEPLQERGGRLRRLKGHIPISVLARTGDPIVVPLAGAEDKAFLKRGVTVKVGNISRNGDTTTFELTISGERAQPQFVKVVEVRPGEFEPPYSCEDHVRVEDDQGQPLWWYPGQVKTLEGGDLQTQVSVYALKAAPAARLLYYGTVATTAEVAFDFTDVPLP